MKHRRNISFSTCSGPEIPEDDDDDDDDDDSDDRKDVKPRTDDRGAQNGANNTEVKALTPQQASLDSII